MFGKGFDYIIIDDPLCPTSDEEHKKRVEKYWYKLINKRVTNSPVSILSASIDAKLCQMK